jgi:hypothetical protein
MLTQLHVFVEISFHGIALHLKKCHLHLQGRRISRTRYQRESRWQAQWLSWLACSTLKIEATCSTETSVYFQRITRRYIAEYRNFRNHRCEIGTRIFASGVYVSVVYNMSQSGHDDVCGSGGIAPPILTSALDGGEWLASRPGRFTLKEGPPVPIRWEAEWGTEPIWKLWREKSFTTTGIRTPAVQPVTRRYTDRAIPVVCHNNNNNNNNNKKFRWQQLTKIIERDRACFLYKAKDLSAPLVYALFFLPEWKSTPVQPLTYSKSMVTKKNIKGI